MLNIKTAQQIERTQAYAIYSESEQSLTFVRPDADVEITAGSEYKGIEVTEVYTGFESTSYNATNFPWVNQKENITKVKFLDEIVPHSFLKKRGLG